MRKANPKKGYFFNLTNMRTHLNLPVALQNYASKSYKRKFLQISHKKEIIWR